MITLSFVPEKNKGLRELQVCCLLRNRRVLWQAIYRNRKTGNSFSEKTETSIPFAVTKLCSTQAAEKNLVKADTSPRYVGITQLHVESW